LSDLDPTQSELGAESRESSISTRPRELDGIVPTDVVLAHSFDDVADALRGASESGKVVIPWGGGTMMGLGNLPSVADVALDLAGLDQVVSYEPDDLTISVQAGCRLGELSRLLAKNGQILPFDVAEPDEATIGGLYCTGVSGPRRFGYGSMRDLVIGITCMSPNGQVSRGGGMVVKNVSGYDMMRLHYGALGSFGVVLQLNFKVLPGPRSVRTAVVPFTSLAEAMAATMAIRESQLIPSAMVMLNESAAAEIEMESQWTLLLRADGPEQSVERQAERLVEVATGSCNGTVLADDESARVWRDVNRVLSARSSDTAIRVRNGVALTESEKLVECLRDLVDGDVMDVSLMADVGNGQVFSRIDTSDGDVERLASCWNYVRELGRHATLLSAPVAVKANTDVFGKEPAGFHIMRTLKQQFDPDGTLNRGRFIGHL
jgi:glycolate oxidase FAD binding subunit